MKPTTHRHLLTSACAAAILAGTVLAQDLPPGDVEPPQPVPGSDTIAPAPATRPTVPATRTAPVPTAESYLEDLLRQRNSGSTLNGGAGNAILPTAPATLNLEIGPDGLLREGQLLQGLTGRLKRDPATGATLVVFEGKATLARMAALPSRRLELMENAAGFSDPKNSLDLVFPIDAEVTQYRGKNYLFIGQSAEQMPKSPATAPATMPDMVAGVLPDPKIEAVAPTAPPMAKIGEGELVEQRVGRLVKDPKTGAEIIVFDGDGKRMLDQPMGLIPSKYLAVMEDASDYGMKPVKFRVSGQITQYRGKNYLYLRSVTIIRDMHGGIGG